MISKVIYEVSEEDFKNAINETLQEIQKQQFLSKYESIIVGAATACEILNISRSTLHRYINAGLLEPEEKNYKQTIRFRLSYLLSIDMKQLKRKLRYGV